MIKVVCNVNSYCRMMNAEYLVFVVYSEQNFSEQNMEMFGIQMRKF